MNKKKKRSIIFCSVLVSAFAIPLIVFAITYNSMNRTNYFQPAEANIQIKEDNFPEDTKQKTNYTLTLNMAKNYSTEKEVAILDQRRKNDEYLRVCFVPMWYDSDGNVCAALNGITDFRTQKLNSTETALLFCNGYGETVMTLYLDSYWKTSWNYEDDGCFYYSGAVKSGETTPPLLTKVEISPSVYEEAKDYILHLDVLADAVQTYGNAKENREWKQ